MARLEVLLKLLKQFLVKIFLKSIFSENKVDLGEALEVFHTRSTYLMLNPKST